MSSYEVCTTCSEEWFCWFVLLAFDQLKITTLKKTFAHWEIAYGGGGGTSVPKYTRKNLTTCSKSADKPSTSCVRMACYNLSTSPERSCQQLVTTLLILSDLLQGCSNKTVTIMIQSCYNYNNIATTLCCQPCSILVIS